MYIDLDYAKILSYFGASCSGIPAIAIVSEGSITSVVYSYYLLYRQCQISFCLLVRRSIC